MGALGLFGGVLVVRLGHLYGRWLAGVGYYTMAAAMGFGVTASIWIDDTIPAIVARMASCTAIAILPVVTFHGSNATAINGKRRRRLSRRRRRRRRVILDQV